MLRLPFSFAAAGKRPMLGAFGALVSLTTVGASSIAAETELPPNPELLRPVPAADDGITDDQVAAALLTPTQERVRVGLGAGVVVRPAASQQAEYQPGFAWGGHATLVFLPWLGLRLNSHLSSHTVVPADGSWGLQAAEPRPPALTELSLKAELEFRRQVAPRAHVWGVAGFGWTRVNMATFELSEPFPASVEARSGIVLELPLGVGAGYAVWQDPYSASSLSVTLDFRFNPILSESGEYFSPQAGQSETVRYDTGQRVQVEGMPTLLATRAVLLGFEATF